MKTLMIIVAIVGGSQNHVPGSFSTQVVDEKECLHAAAYMIAHQEIDVHIDCIPMFTPKEILQHDK